MSTSEIVIRGAREHNLKNIDLTIPRDKLVVITGLSGSGKSSLAFDTIYAEGQRRYVESLSAYARQFLEQMEKPQVESIEGLSPAISIEQKTTSKNPRSTVGTITEIYDYLRLLYARVGQPYCYKCGKIISSQSVSQIVDKVLQLPEKTKFQVLSPIVRGRKGEYRQMLGELHKQGYLRARIDGKLYNLEEVPDLDKNKKHDIAVAVDRLMVKEGIRTRLADSLENALKLSEGLVIINILEKGQPEDEQKDWLFSEKMACVDCGVSYPEMTPRFFSFNNPHGACPGCDGLGEKIELDPHLVIPDPHKSINEGALKAWDGMGGGLDTFYMQKLRSVAVQLGIDLNTPFVSLSPEQQKIILYGTTEDIMYSLQSRTKNSRWEWVGTFEGVVTNLMRRFRQTQSQQIRNQIQKYMSSRPCQECSGARLRPEALAVKVDGHNISQVCGLSIRQALEFFVHLILSPQQQVIACQIFKEIIDRLTFLADVGLDYLTLERQAGTLSGGESERIRLATQIGSRLVGVLYILDEPSIGLHQRDNARLLNTLKGLKELGNTVLVVEHDAETIESADYVIDLGPGAGANGGEVVACGTPEEIKRHPTSLTGQYLSGRLSIPIPAKRRRPKKRYLEITGAQEHNLKNVDVKIPLGLFVCVSGVSGSGKSSLIIEILYKMLARHFYRNSDPPGKHKKITGLEHIDKVIDIDQSPIGRTPRSNPATYTGLFSPLRDLFAELPESRLRGYKPGRYSFNVKGGRCPACEGDGIIKIEMHFLADIYVKCEQCDGTRYNRETLEIKYKGKNISDVLQMSVTQAWGFFENIPEVARKLQTLHEVGLGYVKLGQSATTLSGGEAQRVKLSKELSRRDTGNTLYILDEPTTGLHFDDIKKLLAVLNRLVEAGNTVLVIEHNLDILKTADYLIDLGPEGGDKGGQIIACGTPEEIAANPVSYTGQFLKSVL
ncbi:MAG: excinuclease ABC subunit UvrA [Candidatus Schekmanbacteria bacterium]|nr:excinuclease ABC subunit UvrA [Candidatus Schekmanbacteria bacterium]